MTARGGFGLRRTRNNRTRITLGHGSIPIGRKGGRGCPAAYQQQSCQKSFPHFFLMEKFAIDDPAEERAEVANGLAQIKRAEDRREDYSSNRLLQDKELKTIGGTRGTKKKREPEEGLPGKGLSALRRSRAPPPACCDVHRMDFRIHPSVPGSSERR